MKRLGVTQKRTKRGKQGWIVERGHERYCTQEGVRELKERFEIVSIR